MKISLLLFCSISLFSFVLATEPDPYKCDLKNRPEIDDCFTQPSAQTCGYYEENCPFETCGFPAYNGCAACSNRHVLYYTEGDCKPEEVVQPCTQNICKLDQFPEGLEFYEPVCGIRKGGDTKTFANYCEACQDSEFQWFQTGICEKDKHYCEEKRPTVCNRRYEPVCAHFSTIDVESAYTTVSNGCEACSDPAVEYYTEGECGELRDEATYCLPNNRPEFCTLEYNPVCGFFFDDNGLLDYRVVGNACSACADKDIIYHIPGPCVFKCDRNPNVIYDCVGVLEPVCGVYTEDGKTHKVSLRNNCIGCYYSGKPIETYTDGLCPGDKGIRCENDSGAFLEGILRPVCGYYKEKCTKDSCRKTFAEPILACGDPEVIWYKPGKCPEDKGVPCDAFRKRPKGEDDECRYENVYGYTKKGRKDYDDQYEACKSHDVLYFIQGHC